MSGLDIKVDLIGKEPEEVGKILERCEWNYREWDRGSTDGYEGEVNINGVPFHIKSANYIIQFLSITSDNPNAESVLYQTEFKKYLEIAKVQEVAKVGLTPESLDKCIELLKGIGWNGEPVVDRHSPDQRDVYSLPPFEIRGKKYRAHILTNNDRANSCLRIYSAEEKTAVIQELMQTNLGRFLS